MDVLKIDKSFVDALEYKNVTPHILLKWRKTLKLKMVAEGIETTVQEQWLRQHGAGHWRSGAGYTVKPLPATAFILGRNSAITSHSRKRTVWRGTNGWGPASYIPAHASSALAASFRPDRKQSSVAGEPTEPPLRALEPTRRRIITEAGRAIATPSGIGCWFLEHPLGFLPLFQIILKH